MPRYTAEQLRQGAVSFFGAFDFDERPDGISPRRLPAWTRMRLPQPMDVMVRMPSGVRLAFATASSALRLQVQTTRMVTPPASPRPAAFDLAIDGEVVQSSSFDGGNRIELDRRDPNNYRLVRGDAYEVAFDGLGTGLKRCEIWLPHNAFVEVRALTVDDATTLEATPPPQTRRWLHYGSSISHCMEADTPTSTWPAVAARRARVHLTSLGFGGQCLLDNFVARTLRDTEADIISVKVGINVVNGDHMRERTFTSGVHGLIDTIRERQPRTPLVLVSPIYCPSSETTPGPTIPDASGKFVTIPGHEAIRSGCLTLTRVREIIAATVAVHREAGDAHVHYVDGLELFSAADRDDLPDDLHPNTAGYARMGERFAQRVFAAGGLNLG